MSNRIERALEALKAENKKAFITYVTAGLPDMETTKEIIKAQVGYTDVIAKDPETGIYIVPITALRP